MLVGLASGYNLPEFSVMLQSSAIDGAEVSSEGFTGEGSASRFHSVVGRICFLVVAGLRVSFSCWKLPLVPGNCLLLFVMWNSAALYIRY